MCSSICSRIASCLWKLRVPSGLVVITIMPLCSDFFVLCRCEFCLMVLVVSASIFLLGSNLVLCSICLCCLLVNRRNPFRSFSVLNCKRACVIGFAGQCVSSRLSSIAHFCITSWKILSLLLQWTFSLRLFEDDELLLFSSASILVCIASSAFVIPSIFASTLAMRVLLSRLIVDKVALIVAAILS